MSPYPAAAGIHRHLEDVSVVQRKGNASNEALGAYDDVMIGRIDEVVFDCTDPAVLARFWAGVLGGHPAVRDDSWHFVDVPGFTRLAFQRVPEVKAGKNRLHLDVDVPNIDDAVVLAVSLGAEVLGDRHSDSAGSFQVLLDPEGNEWCLVTPPG